VWHPNLENAMKLLIESVMIVGLTLGAAALVAQGKPAIADVAVADAATSAPCVAGLWAEDSCEVSTHESRVPHAAQDSLSWNSP
jgi:hypothetical protein